MPFRRLGRKVASLKIIISSCDFCLQFFTHTLATNNVFEDFGESVTKDDVIGCSLDLDSNPAKLSFSKNGNSFGAGFEIPQEDLGGRALFPHVS